MKVCIQDHIDIATEERSKVWDKLEHCKVETVGYWKLIAQRKYFDGMITGLRTLEGQLEYENRSNKKGS